MNLNTSDQQEFITVLVTATGATTGVTSVDTDDYSLRYHGFLTLGNSNDTVTVTLNGITGIELSMVGMVECPIGTISVTSTSKHAGNNPSVTRGLLVFGVKRYKKIF